MVAVPELSRKIVVLPIGEAILFAHPIKSPCLPRAITVTIIIRFPGAQSVTNWAPSNFCLVSYVRAVQRKLWAATIFPKGMLAASSI